jgi:hypothetical protein
MSKDNVEFVLQCIWRGVKIIFALGMLFAPLGVGIGLVGNGHASGWLPIALWSAFVVGLLGEVQG